MPDQSGRDRLQTKAEARVDSAAGSLADHPGRWAFGCLGVIIVGGILLTLFGLGGAWVKEGSRVVGPKNVTAQYDAVISDWQELITTADNACSVQTKAKEASDPTVVEDPTVAYQAAYRRVRTDYNSRMQNIFKAKKVGPPGYPRVVPDIPETRGPNADWCAVSEQLLEYHE